MIQSNKQEWTFDPYNHLEESQRNLVSEKKKQSGGSASKESACSAGDLGLIPGLGRSPGEGKGYPLQYSGLENSMDCIVHGVAKSQIRLSGFPTHTHTQKVTYCMILLT